MDYSFTIASTGQSAAQAPQAMQSSVILNAMVMYLHFFDMLILYHKILVFSTVFTKKTAQIYENFLGIFDKKYVKGYFCRFAISNFDLSGRCEPPAASFLGKKLGKNLPINYLVM